jgi:hypothetical protein
MQFLQFRSRVFVYKIDEIVNVNNTSYIIVCSVNYIRTLRVYLHIFFILVLITSIDGVTSCNNVRNMNM